MKINVRQRSRASVPAMYSLRKRTFQIQDNRPSSAAQARLIENVQAQPAGFNSTLLAAIPQHSVSSGLSGFLQKPASSSVQMVMQQMSSGDEKDVKKEAKKEGKKDVKKGSKKDVKKEGKKERKMMLGFVRMTHGKSINQEGKLPHVGQATIVVGTADEFPQGMFTTGVATCVGVAVLCPACRVFGCAHFDGSVNFKLGISGQETKEDVEKSNQPIRVSLRRLQILMLAKIPGQKFVGPVQIAIVRGDGFKNSVIENVYKNAVHAIFNCPEPSFTGSGGVFVNAEKAIPVNDSGVANLTSWLVEYRELSKPDAFSSVNDDNEISEMRATLQGKKQNLPSVLDNILKILGNVLFQARVNEDLQNSLERFKNIPCVDVTSPSASEINGKIKDINRMVGWILAELELDKVAEKELAGKSLKDDLSAEIERIDQIINMYQKSIEVTLSPFLQERLAQMQSMRRILIREEVSKGLPSLLDQLKSWGASMLEEIQKLPLGQERQEIETYLKDVVKNGVQYLREVSNGEIQDESELKEIKEIVNGQMNTSGEYIRMFVNQQAQMLVVQTEDNELYQQMINLQRVLARMREQLGEKTDKNSDLLDTVNKIASKVELLPKLFRQNKISKEQLQENLENFLKITSRIQSECEEKGLLLLRVRRMEDVIKYGEGSFIRVTKEKGNIKERLNDFLHKFDDLHGYIKTRLSKIILEPDRNDQVYGYWKSIRTAILIKVEDFWKRMENKEIQDADNEFDEIVMAFEQSMNEFERELQKEQEINVKKSRSKPEDDKGYSS